MFLADYLTDQVGQLAEDFRHLAHVAGGPFQDLASSTLFMILEVLPRFNGKTAGERGPSSV